MVEDEADLVDARWLLCSGLGIVCVVVVALGWLLDLLWHWLAGTWAALTHAGSGTAQAGSSEWA